MSQEESISNTNTTKAPEASKLLKIIIYVLFMLGPITGNVILVLFGVLSKEFNVNPNALLVSITAFMVPFAIIQLFSGAISDVKGRFPVIIFGLVLFSLGMVVAATSISLTMFVIANILGGIGFGFVNPVLIALMTDITPSKSEIPKKMGYLGAIAALGVGVGPLLASQMIQIGWRYLYIFFIVIIIVSLIVLFTLKQPAQESHKVLGPRILFSHLSQEIQKPIVILMIISAFLTSITYLAIVIWTSRAFVGVVNESIAGIMLSFVGLAGAVSGLINGNLIKRKGVGFTLTLGLISLLLAIILMIIIDDVTSTDNLVYVAVGLLLAGVAGGILFPSIMYYSQIFSPERRGALAGLTTAGYFIGIAIVPIIYAPLFLKWGINAVYRAVLGVAFLFSIVIFLLYNLTKRKL